MNIYYYKYDVFKYVIYYAKTFSPYILIYSFKFVSSKNVVVVDDLNSLNPKVDEETQTVLIK